MVDFQKVNIVRLSNSVILQHIWNSIEDLTLAKVLPTKANVTDVCHNTYNVNINDINKNLFLALKEGTISRDIKTDVLSKVDSKIDTRQGDWYCFLCHGPTAEERCVTCNTSVHSKCNESLAASCYHCHTCKTILGFASAMQRLSPAAQKRLLERAVHPTAIAARNRVWNSLQIVGYLETTRNRFFLYRQINSGDIDRRLTTNAYISSAGSSYGSTSAKRPGNSSSENAFFDLMLLRHNCAVIYGQEHDFFKLTNSYIRALNTELHSIYCDSCYLLQTGSKSTGSASSTSTNIASRRQQLFATVCSQRHPILWGLIPPNVFWPFKMIREDNDRYFGIKFSRSVHKHSLEKLEIFHKDTCLAWNSYNLQVADRPSTELVFAVSLAQKYAQNLVNFSPSEQPNCSKSYHKSSEATGGYSSKTKRKPKLSKADKLAASQKSTKSSELVTEKRKVGRPKKKGKPGRPRKIVDTTIHSKVKGSSKSAYLSDDLSSISSSNGSVYLPKNANKIVAVSPKINRKRVADIFGSDTEVSKKMFKGSQINPTKTKRKRKCKTKAKIGEYLSSTDSDSSSSQSVEYYSNMKSISRKKPLQATTVKLDFINHESIPSPSVHSSPIYQPLDNQNIGRSSDNDDSNQDNNKHNDDNVNGYTDSNERQCGTLDSDDNVSCSTASTVAQRLLTSRFNLDLNKNSASSSRSNSSTNSSSHQTAVHFDSARQNPINISTIAAAISSNTDSDTTKNSRGKRRKYSKHRKSHYDKKQLQKQRQLQHQQLGHHHISHHYHHRHHRDPDQKDVDCLPHQSSKYSACYSSPYHSVYNQPYLNEFNNVHDSMKGNLKDGSQCISPPKSYTGKDLMTVGSGPSRTTNNIESGVYCSSSSPINFSPMSNNYPANLPQVSIHSTPSSNCMMSSDEIVVVGSATATSASVAPSTGTSASGGMKLKFRSSGHRQQLVSPLQFGSPAEQSHGTEINRTSRAPRSPARDRGEHGKSSRRRPDKMIRSCAMVHCSEQSDDGEF